MVSGRSPNGAVKSVPRPLADPQPCIAGALSSRPPGSRNRPEICRILDGMGNHRGAPQPPRVGERLELLAILLALVPLLWIAVSPPES